VRILHIINSLATGGAEKLILETIPRYNEEGVIADLLLLNGSSEPFLEVLKEMNCCKVFILGTGSPYNIQYIRKIIPYLGEYDLIHAHLFPSNYFLAIAKFLSRSKTPIVFTEHNTSNRRFRSKSLLFINKYIYRIYNKIICITEEVKKEVIRLVKVPSKDLTVINNGVDVVKYAEAEAMPRQLIDPRLMEQDFLILQVSSFREQKDQNTVIRSLKFLPDNVKILFAGEGPLRRECEDLVQNMNMEGRVFFLGNRNDIPQLLKTSDVNILSSHYEGLSLASIEGMAAGRPFLASNVPGLADIVSGYGIVFPQGDEEQLAHEIINLINNKRYYMIVSEKGQERASNYDLSTMIEEHIKLYKELMASPE